MDSINDSVEEVMAQAEADAKASFKEAYSQEWLDKMSRQSTSGTDIVEIMYQSYVAGYFAALGDQVGYHVGEE